MPIKPDGRNCTKCELFKPWALFPKAAGQKSGYRPRCLDCHRQQNREYAALNRDRNNERGKLWSKVNREKARERERIYKSSEKVKAYNAAYWRTEKFRRRATEKTMRRKALIKSATVEKVDYQKILDVHGMVCHLCGGQILPGFLDFDHVVPLSKGGAHSYENIRPSHSSCNRSKRDHYAD